MPSRIVGGIALPRTRQVIGWSTVSICLHQLRQSVATPAFRRSLRAPLRTKLGHYDGRGCPLNISALAILIPHRALTTDTSTSSGGVPTGPPPPGFNTEAAKKSISNDLIVKATTPARSSIAKPTPSDAPATSGDQAAGTVKSAATDQGSLSDIASKRSSEQAPGDQVIEAKKEVKKLTIAQKIKKEILHYWDGTKLLATEVKISTKLAVKMAAGYELSRREHRQVS